jgi:hypothetical protein
VPFCSVGSALRRCDLARGNSVVDLPPEAAEAANEDFLKRWIRIEGPEKILAWAADLDPSIEWENQYAHRCQACRRIYADDRVKAVIREHHGAKIPTSCCASGC